MKRLLQLLSRFCAFATKPLTLNSRFVVFMYALGCVSAWITLPDTRNARLYENLYLELALDVYCAAAVLALLPRMARRIVRACLYVALYAAAIADVYCFIKFQSTLNPTMLMLVGETDSREAGEFLSTFLSADIIFSDLGWVLLLLLLHILLALPLRFPHILPSRLERDARLFCASIKAFFTKWQAAAGFLLLSFMVWAAVVSADNKAAIARLMSYDNIGEVERELTRKDKAVLYLPIYRLAFSIYANSLAAQQIGQLESSSDLIRIDSCAYTSPNIVLIIGESYNRHHSQMYGYALPTTPRQLYRAKKDRLTAFTDVVSPHNLTSFVFKNLFSMHVIGEPNEWCDYPLFPEIFRRSGYHVAFFTNQFLPKTRDAVYDFSGGFFLNDPELSSRYFDTRNQRLHQYDENLLEEYDELKSRQTEHNLIIFHLIGQHVSYRQRSPKDRKRFKASDYEQLKPNLNKRERRILSDYDNAILYNDSVVDQIIARFENEEAIIVYVPDHGEECYEGNQHFYCRNHTAQVDARLAHAEFDIPFWIWCSRSYAKRHPDIYKRILKARKRRFMTDALPHTLLKLAGIASPQYRSEFDLLSDDYREERPRLLKGTTDYDRLDQSSNPYK